MKIFILGRRAANVSRAAAHHHMLHVHGRMVVLAPPDAGPLPSPYVQNHVQDGAYPPAILTLPREIDLVTEINFADLATLQAANSTPYYRDHLQPDEPSFVDTASVVRLPIAGTQDVAGRGGPGKAIVLGLRGCDPAALGDRFAALAGGRAYRIHRVADAAAPCAVVIEGWAETIAAALAWGQNLRAEDAVVLAAAEVTAAQIRGLSPQ